MKSVWHWKPGHGGRGLAGRAGRGLGAFLAQTGHHLLRPPHQRHAAAQLAGGRLLCKDRPPQQVGGVARPLPLLCGWWVSSRQAVWWVVALSCAGLTYTLLSNAPGEGREAPPPTQPRMGPPRGWGASTPPQNRPLRAFWNFPKKLALRVETHTLAFYPGPHPWGGGVSDPPTHPREGWSSK